MEATNLKRGADAAQLEADVSPLKRLDLGAALGCMASMQRAGEMASHIGNDSPARDEDIEENVVVAATKGMMTRRMARKLREQEQGLVITDPNYVSTTFATSLCT